MRFKPTVCALILATGAAMGEMRVAAFRADATPEMGEPTIWTQPVKEVMDRLWVKGVVVDDGKQRVVIAAIDWCGVGGSIHRKLRERLAAGAGTAVERVALQSVHQHAAPYVDGDGYEVLKKTRPLALRMSDGYLERLGAKMEAAAREAVGRLAVFDEVRTGAAEVERVASARRLMVDGKLQTRFSSTAKSPELAAQPEGDVDRRMRTLSFVGKGKALASVSFYATHPQTFCCDGRVSGDFVNAARARVESAMGVEQVYFTGGAGNVTVGKYNQGEERQRRELGERLAAGWVEALKATGGSKVRGMEWRRVEMELPARRESQGTWDKTTDQGAYRAAIVEAFAGRGRRVEAYSLRLGGVVVVFLPGEPLLEFQRFAQSLERPGLAVMVAGYGDMSPGYLCPDKVIEEGGYEPSASNAGPGTEAQVKEAIVKLVKEEAKR